MDGQTHTTQILASLPEDLDLERVSEITDKIHDNNQNQNVYATSYNSTNDKTPRNAPTPTNTTSQTTTPDRLTDLLQGMANLTLQVQSLVKFQAFERSRPYRTSSRRRSRSRSSSFSRERRTYDTCWYHFKFGCEARKCIKPCRFNSTSQRIRETVTSAASKDDISCWFKTRKSSILHPGQEYQIFIFSRHRRTNKRYSTGSQEKPPTIFIHTASGKWIKN